MFGALDQVAAHGYRLCLILAAVTLGLAPLHQLGVQHANVLKLRPDARIELSAAPGGLVVGDSIGLYRFNPGWMRPFGTATVEQVGPDTVVAHLDKPTFTWPPGRQGTVVDQHDSRIVLDVGSEIDVVPGRALTLFQGRTRVGSAQVTAAGDGWAEARLDDPVDPDVRWVGASATLYEIVDHVAWFRSPVLWWLEVLTVATALGLWAWGIVSPVPGQRWRAACARLRARIPRDGAASLGAQLLLGVPVVWICGQVLWYATTWVAHNITVELYVMDVLPDLGWPAFNDRGVPVLWALGAAAWVGYLVTQRSSPAIALWHALRWRPLPWPSPQVRGAVLWVAHLAIAYAFASTLWGFLNGNVAALRDLWPLTGLAAFYEAARYTLWSATIVGCLVGYGHTVLSIVWTRTALKHLDFTPMGWLTNALCYYPLLGVALMHAFPDLHGTEPILVEGPLSQLRPITELLLNLCYTLSIWNLGKMFGVMADKGVRTWGFYGVVRHPSYTLEALMFMVMYLSGASTPLQWLAASSYLLKYWLRSEREDQFMTEANPEYAAYRDRVPDKFVPGLY